MLMRFECLRQTFWARNYADASALFCEARDASGLGVSKLQGAALRKGMHVVGWISYNGKIWPSREWKSGMVPLFDPYRDSDPLCN